MQHAGRTQRQKQKDESADEAPARNHESHKSERSGTVCLFVCLFTILRLSCGGRPPTRDGPYATRRQAEAVPVRIRRLTPPRRTPGEFGEVAWSSHAEQRGKKGMAGLQERGQAGATYCGRSRGGPCACPCSTANRSMLITWLQIGCCGARSRGDPSTVRNAVRPNGSLCFQRFCPLFFERQYCMTVNVCQK